MEKKIQIVTDSGKWWQMYCWFRMSCADTLD